MPQGIAFQDTYKGTFSLTLNSRVSHDLSEHPLFPSQSYLRCFAPHPGLPFSAVVVTFDLYIWKSERSIFSGKGYYSSDIKQDLCSSAEW